MDEVRRIVDNRTLILGLDNLYREAMKIQERGDLLRCARQVAGVLYVTPADVPVEGYYTEDPQLTEYFKLMRALQGVSGQRAAEVNALSEFERLVAVTSAPLYGKLILSDNLLPAGIDPLSQALGETEMSEWSLPHLTEAAYRLAAGSDDFSLVGLAARTKDALLLTATRESAVLYAEVAFGCVFVPDPPPLKNTGMPVRIMKLLVVVFVLDAMTQ